MGTYNKKTWVNGETIYADDLNHMEQGIADANGNEILMVEESLSQDENSYELSKNYTEIVDYFTRGLVLVSATIIETGESLSSETHGISFVIACDHSSSTDGVSTTDTYEVTVVNMLDGENPITVYESDSATGVLRTRSSPK